MIESGEEKNVKHSPLSFGWLVSNFVDDVFLFNTKASILSSSLSQ